MRKRLTIVIAILAVLAAAAAAWLLVARRPAEAPPTAPAPAPAEAPKEGRAVIGLYLADPADLSEVTERVELTLLKAEAIRADGTETIFDGSVRVMIQRGRSEKILSAPAKSGRFASVRLTFAPVATVVKRTGATETLYVADRQVEAVLERDVPLGRTVLGAIRLPLATAFTVRNDVPALSLPARVPGEYATVGGLLIGDAGRLFETQGAALRDLVLIEYGLDLATVGRPGSAPLAPPTSPQPR